MSLNYFGYKIKGNTINPSILNAWLTLQSGFSTCAINWAIMENIADTITVDISYLWSPDLNELKNEIASGYPVILWYYPSSNMHFVVATGYNGDTLYLNDPVSGQTTKKYSDVKWKGMVFIESTQPPASFNKSFPTNSALNQRMNPTLEWTGYTGAEKYQYCVKGDNSNNQCPSGWQDNNDLSTDKTVGPLALGKTYYWQVRALKNSTWTEADNKVWWSFTVATPPGPFSKNPPSPAASAPSTTPITLSWSASSGATVYKYCYDTSNNNTCDSPAVWTSARNNTSVTLPSGLNPSIYYWQVCAENSVGAICTDGGTWQSFTVLLGSFDKASPAYGNTNQPKRPTLAWSASLGASGYEYCLSTKTGCTGSTAPFTWTPTSSTSVIISSDLAVGTIYYWQVRALSSSIPGSYTYADGDANTGGDTAAGAAWWSFRVPQLPGAFAKQSPANGATNVRLTEIEEQKGYMIQWNANSDAAWYEYCLSTANGTCTGGWVRTKEAPGSGVPYACTGIKATCALVTLSPGVTYYWQVRAVNVMGTTVANGGTWWSFRTASQSIPTPTHGPYSTPTPPRIFTPTRVP